MQRTLVVLAIVTAFLLPGCDAPSTRPTASATVNQPRTDSSGRCEKSCDAAEPSLPVITQTRAYGNVTTYGDVVNPAPSAGGACNYGSTAIMRFAAIQVSVSPGDLQGQWQGGRICGQCAVVRVRTTDGWKSTAVRIMDKCPDGYCGIDLGGEPAREVFGTQSGRYSGEWTWVSCDGLDGVSDALPAIHVKEGSNPYWSLIQIRNPAERILGIRMRRADLAEGAEWRDLAWATEAENFFKVPIEILQDSSMYGLEALLPEGKPYTAILKGSALAAEKADLRIIR